MVPPQPLNVAIDLKIPGLPVPHMTQKVLHLIEVIWDTATTQPWEVSIDIELPGILMAQPRARFRVFQTKQGKPMRRNVSPQVDQRLEGYGTGPRKGSIHRGPT